MFIYNAISYMSMLFQEGHKIFFYNANKSSCEGSYQIILATTSEDKVGSSIATSLCSFTFANFFKTNKMIAFLYNCRTPSQIAHLNRKS